MGVYLSTPNTEKNSCDEICKNFTYGASSMQGWRMTQEDAHNCLPDYEENAAFFAVYDGHGGAEVAQYCAANLPPFLKESRLYKEGKYIEALEEAYLGFDALLTTPEVIKELKVLAGVESDDEHEDDKSLSLKQKKSEAELLRQEADMPIEELMAKYEYGETPQQPRTRILRKKGHSVNSPVIKPKKMPFPTDANDNSANKNTNEDINVEEKISNGHAENENNLNLEKESQMSSVPISSSVQQDIVSSSVDGSSASSVSSTAKCSSSTAVTSSNQADCAVSSNTSPGSSKAGSSKASSSRSSGSSKSDNVGSTESAEASSSMEVRNAGSSSTSGGASSSNSSEATCGSSSETVSGSSSSQGGSSSAGGSSSKSRKRESSSEGNVDVDGEDDEEWESEEDINEEMDSDDEDGDDDYEGAGSDDEDEEDDDEEESEETDEEESCTPVMNEMTEEPGSDSGTTAVVALIKDKQIFVANAGDSRCVLCRGGKALDLSADHKPEDLIEKTRIEAAGGKVTEEGRVNGGLNMSRAIGDHFYKRNIEKSAKEQMITALPDIETASLQETDEFLVLACDGIWNYMTSQEVVDFVREKMKEEENRKKLSLICEMLFDKCLAPNTLGDGTGCDNMTCIIVTFDQIWNNNKNKRPAENVEDNAEKRRRMDDT